MNSRLLTFLIFVTATCVSGCSQIIEKNPFANQVAPEVLKPLKEIKTSQKVNKVWQINTGLASGNNKINPFLESQTIYIAGSGAASALDANTGALRWKTSIDEMITAGISGNAQSNPSATSAVTPNTSKVYLGTDNGNAIALNAKTGKIEWIERLSSEILSVSPSKNGRVIFRTVDGKLHGLSSKTGELIWERTQKSPSLIQLGAGVPIVVSNLVIAGFDNGKVAAYDLQTGQPVWETVVALPTGISGTEDIIDVDGKMKALGNALFASSLNGGMVGINMQSGKKAWSIAFSSPNGVDVNSKGLYSSDDKGVIWGIDPQTGDPRWTQDILQGRHPSVPMIVNDSTLVVTDIEGNIHFINITSAEFTARVKGDLSGYSVAPLVSGNNVYLFGKSGLLSKYSL